MNTKENKINSLVYALLFLIFGIFLLTREDLIAIIAKFLGGILILMGLVKSIVYIYMKGKLGEYSLSNLVKGLLIMLFGLMLILYSGTFSFALRTIVGFWILFSAINKAVLAISLKPITSNGFWIYLLTSIIMFILGIVIMTVVLDKLIALIIIIYSIIEIFNYIYSKINIKEDVLSKPIIEKKNNKKYKKGKVIDAIIEESK